MTTWTQDQLQTITHRMKECEKKKKEHLETARIYDTFDKGTGLPQIVLSSILSTTTLSNINEENTSR